MAKQPNIVWIMADQHRADALGCVNNWMHTPNLDRLADNSVHFTNMFAQSPVCVPSRSNFITGRYPHAHGVRENDTRIGYGEPHMFRVLKKSGYTVAAVGKNHMLAESELCGFDYERLNTCELQETDPDDWKEHIHAVHKRMVDQGCWAGACWHSFPENVTGTHRTANAACDFLTQQTSQEPFCLWVSFSDPHAPHTTPQRFQHLYPEDNIPLPHTEHRTVDGKHKRMAIKKLAQGSHNASDKQLRKYRSVYAGMISFVDEQVGRILDTITQMGIDDHTIIVYTADHGDFCTSYGMTKKDLVLYDDLLNIPCLIRWTPQFPTTQTSCLAEQIDIYPTLLECCNIKQPDGIQGQSLAPLLHGHTYTHRNTIHAEICYPDMRCNYTDPKHFLKEWTQGQTQNGHPLQYTAPYNIPGDYNKAIRTEQYKYIWYGDGFEELYNLQQDPCECINIATNPEQQAILEEMRQKLGAWHMHSEDPLSPKTRQHIEHTFPFSAAIS